MGSEEEQENEDNNGLAIGAFEAAFCADTSATYVYEMCESIIEKLRYAGTYRDDGLAIFDERKTVQQAIAWLRNFQLLVDEVVGGTYFQFTAEVWKPLEALHEPTSAIELEGIPPEEWEKWKEKVKVIEENVFPYLDMKLSWRHDNLHFSVYNKENQTIKYVNKESCHRTLVFKAVPAGLFTHIS